MNAAAEAAGLLDDIVRNPRDRTARLVYADWLEEFGTPDQAHLASFIRRQVLSFETVRLDAGCRYVEGQSGSGAFAPPDARPWAVSFHCPVGVDSCTIAGGFVEEAFCSAAAWRSFGPRLVREHPLSLVVVATYKPVVPNRAAGVFGWERSTTRLADMPQSFSISATSYVPADVWALLPPAGRHRWAGGLDGALLFPGWALYRSAALAEAALSDALLAWAWKQEVR